MTQAGAKFFGQELLLAEEYEKYGGVPALNKILVYDPFEVDKV